MMPMAASAAPAAQVTHFLNEVQRVNCITPHSITSVPPLTTTSKITLNLTLCPISDTGYMYFIIAYCLVYNSSQSVVAYLMSSS